MDRVEDPDGLRLIIDIERRNPLTGSLGEPNEPPARFTGWTGLAAALDRALDARRGQPGPRPDAADREKPGSG